MLTFGDGPDYWDTHYLEDPKAFDWMASYEDLRELLSNAMDNSKTLRILYAGCGNSLLAEDMYDDGYTSMVNMDSSSVVINQMINRNAEIRGDMKWLVGDATSMTFEDGSFDLIIDKGLLDALCCSEDSAILVPQYLKEVMRVLVSNGTFACVSMSKPENWIAYTQSPYVDWNMGFTPLQEDIEFTPWFYLCSMKGAEAKQKALQRWQYFLEARDAAEKAQGEAAALAERSDSSLQKGALKQMDWLEKERLIYEAAGVGFGDGNDYWNPFYLKEPDPFDWLCDFEDLTDILGNATDGVRTRRILNIGCGNSLLSEAMYDSGYTNIVNIDQSDVAIDQMQKRNYGLRENMTWLVGDARSMDFGDSSFDVVLDKGLFDALECGENYEVDIPAFWKEVMRVLRNGGVYLCISISDPKRWETYMERLDLDWSVSITRLSSENFIYLCRKKRANKEPTPRSALIDNKKLEKKKGANSKTKLQPMLIASQKLQAKKVSSKKGKGKRKLVMRKKLRSKKDSTNSEAQPKLLQGMDLDQGSGIEKTKASTI
eukprot:gnl/MRDRNA2_/MRDRNA2_78968_c0_seq1.p1 gnl/MRDRNA2_/MRDRNA2_78968_c0~~gnl/MRDRNA2_/MRDRNA2_78968_c0_seq1.p1  ORF type:complete len:543 (+),score=120.55 gnl/MRDRNA2_/MRDRNA2_78968_c0_seq1:141-1769(+)